MFDANKPDIAAAAGELAEYLRFSTDKDPPPYFAGRRHIISDIEDACNSSWTRFEDDKPQPKAATRVIYGAPGAGKTSTLKFLENRWLHNSYVTPNADGTIRRSPTPLMLFLEDCSALLSPGWICEQLANLLASGKGDSLYSSKNQSVRPGGYIGAGLPDDESKSERTVQSSDTIAELNAMLKAIPPHSWTRPLVIGVDEAQNLPSDPNSFIGRLFRLLHANLLNLPVTLVAAGLPETAVRVKELGLTRLSDNCAHSLDRLSREETEDLERVFCSHFGINLKNRSARFNAMLAACDGWPAHIANALQTFGRTYLAHDLDIGTVDFDELELQIAEQREVFYKSQLSMPMNLSD